MPLNSSFAVSAIMHFEQVYIHVYSLQLYTLKVFCGQVLEIFFSQKRKEVENGCILRNLRKNEKFHLSLYLPKLAV